MKVLLIGNGFDIAHGLPTSYNEFLNFCEMFKGSLASGKPIFLNGDKVSCPYYVSAELENLIGHNAWLEYFLNASSYIGENWIDFESEIARVIRILDDVIILKFRNLSMANLADGKSSVLALIVKCSGKSMIEAVGDVKAIHNFILFLNTELERLIRALEIYIAEFVNEISVTKKNIDIVNLTPDHILSFNYSNTYERVYDQKKQVEYDYIHGKADIKKNIHTSNLVLGIDEYLDDKRKNVDLDMIMFKKFYQRIFKSTSNVYLNWVEEIRNDLTCKHDLYIFGHSLDVTDRDVIKLFICNDNVQTKIFYYRKNIDDKKELGKKISNLVRIIGQEELIRRTGGKHRSIEFVPQAI